MRSLLLALTLPLIACSPETARDGTSPPTSLETTMDPLRYRDAGGRIRTSLVKQPFHGGRNVAELSRNPDYLEEGGIARILADAGHDVGPIRTAGLTPEEDEEYGEWHRMGLANGHLAGLVAENENGGRLTLGLLGNCNALLGMLGGLQRSSPDGVLRRVGLVWIDAHGDFNTPETTLSGMLGGMPVAVAAGLALERLRRESGLEKAMNDTDIVMAAVRDLDPEERELVQAHGIVQLTTQDLRERSGALHAQMRRLSESTDIIYVHVDMDVLDPAEVPGHGLTVPGGPTSQELAAALTEMFRYPKVGGLGIASTPAYEDDPGGISRQAAYRLILGAVAGVAER